MSAPRHRKPCKVIDCTSLVHVRGMCQSHARRWRLYGDPLGVPVCMSERVIRDRRAVGLPDTGPTAAMIGRWQYQEALNDVGWIS